MDELVLNFVKFLSSTVIVRIMSYPSFAIEILLASVICIVHSLLIFEINTLVQRSNARAAARVRVKRPIKDGSESCSFHSLVTMKTTQVFHKKPNDVYQRTTQMYSPITPKGRFSSRGSNFAWALSKGDSIMRHRFSDRVEHLLSITPSEYVRRDRERKCREQGLRSCLQSLTSLLEKALSTEDNHIPDMSKTDIQKSINTLKENFELQLAKDHTLLKDLASPSIQNMIQQANEKQLLRNSLAPCPAMYMGSPTNLSKSKSSIVFDKRGKKRRSREDDDEDDNRRLTLKSSASFSELFTNNSADLFGDKIGVLVK